MGNCFKKQTIIAPQSLVLPPPPPTLPETEEKPLNSAPPLESPPHFKKPIFKREGTTTSLMDIRNIYKFEPKIIGNGYFGTVRVATLINNPSKKFAVKTIFKEKIQKSLHLLKRELEILKTLDHPNIVKFYETYQDDKFFHFVMEYCSGGELLARIADSGYLSEKEAAAIMKKIFSGVKYLHERGVVHRDLKPENFLFSHKGRDAEIKIIDFGLSKQFEAQNDVVNMQTMVGTAFYVAPEVLLGNYDYRCDNWSLGVITYILLCGQPPFYAETPKEVFQMVRKGKFSFKGNVWKKISKQAKEFISKLLCVDLKKRMNAEEALQHLWLNMNIKEKNHEKTKINPAIVKSIKSFIAAGHLKKEVMKLIVNNMSEVELKTLKETFRFLDKENKGKISLGELKKALEDLGYQEYLSEMTNLMKTHKNQEISYSEFIAANLEKNNYFKKDKLYQAFKHFDIDNSETINVRNLKESMAREGRKLSNEELALWIKEADHKNTGKIGFEEFMNMMKHRESQDSVILETSVVGLKAGGINTEEEDFFKETKEKGNSEGKNVN